jgi:thiosulfate/3-mercaptopyruvate sulfurtransferase
VIPPIVDLAWWQRHREDVVPADCRFYLDGRSAREAYDRGHIPGAVFVDLEQYLAGHGEPHEGRHPLPTPKRFAEGLSGAGIGDGTTVVAYDDAGGVMAARLVWMLRALGQDAALLDGGLAAYDGELSTEDVVPEAAVTDVRPWPGPALADIEAATDRRSVVLDARDSARYRGETEPVDPVAGHIPGALSLPTREHLDRDGRFLPVLELRRRFAAVGVEEGTPVVSYCGSGVTACHALLALEHAGLGTGRLYAGSWSAYSNTPGRPVATGPEPG